MRDIRVPVDARRHTARPPELPDAVYDDIADVLVAEAERMASSGSFAESGTSVNTSSGRRRR
jgi:hypothetical protein